MEMIRWFLCKIRSSVVEGFWCNMCNIRSSHTNQVYLLPRIHRTKANELCRSSSGRFYQIPTNSVDAIWQMSQNGFEITKSQVNISHSGYDDLEGWDWFNVLNLVKLNLSHNHLTDLPHQFRKEYYNGMDNSTDLPKLEILDLRNNPIPVVNIFRENARFHHIISVSKMYLSLNNVSFFEWKSDPLRVVLDSSFGGIVNTPTGSELHCH